VLGIRLDYASPSAFLSQKERALVGFSAETRSTLRFKGKVKAEANFLLRTALRSLGDVLWTDDRWWAETPNMVLDPIVTVHRDKLFFEAFSFDQTAHALLSIDLDLFEVEGETVCGSSNIDFTAWLWGALGEMRSSRDTWLHIDTAGLDLRSLGAGGRFERNLELPESWLRGYLELQAASTLPGIRLKLRPVDLLGVVRFLRYSKPKTSPRALRYEFEPGEPARIVLEPWEEQFVLQGTEHGYNEPKSTRLWGRNRLKLLEPLLPFADSVEVYLKGRGMPSFYALQLPGLEFTLSLSSRTQERFTSSGLSHLLWAEEPEVELLDKALEYLREQQHVSRRELARHLGVEEPPAGRILGKLCSQGRALHSPSSGRYRHRELLSGSLELDRIYTADERPAKARALLDTVKIAVCETRQTKKVKRLSGPNGKVLREIVFTDWHIEGEVGDQPVVLIVLNPEDRIIFGKCGCPHFRENLLTEGPCEHMLALREACAEQRNDPPTSLPAEEVQEE
jgi:hypothetical protein